MELKAYTEGEDDSPFVILETDQGTRIIERGDGTISILLHNSAGGSDRMPYIATRCNANDRVNIVITPYKKES